MKNKGNFRPLGGEKRKNKVKFRPFSSLYRSNRSPMLHTENTMFSLSSTLDTSHFYFLYAKISLMQPINTLPRLRAQLIIPMSSVLTGKCQHERTTGSLEIRLHQNSPKPLLHYAKSIPYVKLFSILHSRHLFLSSFKFSSTLTNPLDDHNRIRFSTSFLSNGLLWLYPLLFISIASSSCRSKSLSICKRPPSR